MKHVSLSTQKQIDEAIARLRAGEPVVIPTETVYGLAADACNDQAVSSIYAMKERPRFNPLIVHVTGPKMAQRYGGWNELADELAAEFWPGPLTLIVKRAEDCPLSLLVSAGGDTVGLRMPASEITQTLLKQFDGGLAAPSANRSGRVSPTCPEHVQAEFPDNDLLILDGGKTTLGIESTVVDCTGDHPIILRPGSITAEMIEDSGFECSFHKPGKTKNETMASPGMLNSHYAPSLPLRMNAVSVNEKEALIAFGPAPVFGAAKMINLSERGNLTEAGAHLFAAMRELDSPEFSGIAVMPIPDSGVGIAINDRLKRAAAKK